MNTLPPLRNLAKPRPECGCYYVDERLMCPAHRSGPDLLALLEQAEAIMRQFHSARVGKFWLPNWLAGARYRITEAGGELHK